MVSRAWKAVFVVCVLFVLGILAKPFLSEIEPVIVKDTRGDIRLETGVRELRPTEDRRNISQLPNGVFGYTNPSLLEELNHIGFLPLDAGGRDDPENKGVEVHKTSQGKIVVLLYMGQSDLAPLRDPDRIMPLRAHAYLEKHGEYDQLIGLPLSRLIAWHSRSGESGGRGAEFVEIKVR